MKKAVFIDRDGTLIENRGYICHYHEVGIYSFSFAAVRRLNRLGFSVFIVTNQSAVARGICKEAEIESLHQQLTAEFTAAGARISGIYCCPFHTCAIDPVYRKESPLRKPRPGMLLQAAREHTIDLGRSFMIGDSLSDVEAGIRAGCHTVMVKTGHGERELAGMQPDCRYQPHRVCADLRSAVDYIECRLKF